MHVLMISLDAALGTQPQSETRQRHHEYAARAGKLTIVVYTPRAVPASPYAGDDLTIIPTCSLSRYTFALDAIRLGLRAANQTPVDLITTQDPFLTGLAGWWLRGRLRAPLLAQNHSHFFENPAWLAENPLRNRAFSVIGRFVVGRADMYRTVNRRERDYYLKLGGSPKRVVTIPLASASEAFARPVEEPVLQTRRAELGLNPADKVILWVGRPVQTKRIPALLRVFQRVAQQEAAARLLLVGDMAQSPDDLPIVAAELGIAANVIFAGQVAYDDLPPYYALAQVYALTSAYEGMPRVLSEAASAGLPIVAMDGAVGAAEFIEDGVNGYLVRDMDIDGMAERILALLRDPALAQKMGAAARELALSQYNAAHNADAIVMLWEKTVEMGMRGR